MVAPLKTYKLLNVPATWEPNAVYYIKSGANFSHYVTEDDGTPLSPTGGGGGGGGVTDHGALSGLGDDDHSQYHNNARGDARYSQLGHAHAIADVTGLQAAIDGKEASGAAASAIASHVAASDPHSQYVLESALSDYLTTSAAALAYQPLDADLTAIAALSTDAAGRSILTLTDPNADRIAFWDDSAGSYAHLAVGSGLSITGTTLAATGGGSTYVESSPITLSSATDGSQAFAHGLGAVPDKFGFLLQCAVANNGYSVGDRISISGFRSATNTAIVSADATNVTLCWDGVGSQSCFIFVPKSGGAAITGTGYTDWTLILWAEA